MDGKEISHEEVELKSPFPVIPPVKDSKWNTPPHTPDGQSQPLEPPKLYPDIGEEHPCPYFVGPDVNFIRPGRKKKKPVVPTPVIPPPVIPASVPPPPRVPTPPAPSTEKPSNCGMLPHVYGEDATSYEPEEDEIIEACLEECIHGVVWECIAERGKDMTREMYCALVASNPEKFILDRTVLTILWKKISKKVDVNNWTEPCEPIDRLHLDVLSCQAYKMFKARFTVTNEAISNFHRKTVVQATSRSLLDQYAIEMKKKLKKQDSKDMKMQPPRVATFLPY